MSHQEKNIYTKDFWTECKKWRQKLPKVAQTNSTNHHKPTIYKIE